ncbi:MAG: radical SAM family heme chaperone HemW [Reichenbachiella sp.]
MAGIYVHIPFCKQACHYCDFHFSTNIKTKDDLIDAIIDEIELQKNYLPNTKIETIYYGGGTPSILKKEDFQRINSKLQSTFNFSQMQEVTLEANPDDLTIQKLTELKTIGFNRLSIGIQTFDDQLLKFYNRAHNSSMALDSVKNAQKVGFENITIDLIFGAPNQSTQGLQSDLQKALELNTPHISIYGLTIEEKTAFGKWQKSGKLKPLDEEIAAEHFELIMETLTREGFVQYEISNFSKHNFESKHNSAYWQGKNYLGIGPSAHSFNGTSRQYNIASNLSYIKQIRNGVVPCEIEILSKNDQINEMILIQMRTAEGLDMHLLNKKFDYDLASVKKQEIEALIKSGKLINNGQFLKLTDTGKLLADFIIEKFII